MRLTPSRPPTCITSWTAYDPAYPDRALWWDSLALAHSEQLPCCLCDASVDDPDDLTRVAAVRPRALALYLARGGPVRVIIPRRYRTKSKTVTPTPRPPMRNATTTLQRLINKVPLFMHPELDRVETLDDLLFQLAHEIDLAISGAIEPRWTAPQLHRAKMLAATVHIAAQRLASRTEPPV